MAGRAGVSGGIAAERLEVLWGSRGNSREWALRRGELADVQRVIADTKKSLDDLRKGLEKVKDDIDALNVAVDDLQGQMDDIEGRIDGAEDALDELERLIADIEGRLGPIDENIAALQTDVSLLQTDVAALQGNVSSVSSDVAFLQTDLTALAERVTASEGDIADLQIDVHELRVDVDELELGAAFLNVTTNLNSALRNKEFQWSDTSTNTPVAGSYGRGFTIASSATDLTQVGIVNGTGQVFIRYMTGGVWGAWVVWASTATAPAEPYALQSNPGATPFAAGVFAALPFYTNGELSGGITLTSNTRFTVPVAGLYQFELEVRINGGATSMPPVGAAFALSIDTTTVPTVPRPGYSISDVATAMTITRLVCTERLTAGAQRVAYILNQGAAAYQVTSAVVKITRLSA